MKKLLFSILGCLTIFGIVNLSTESYAKEEFPYQTTASSIGDSEKLGSQLAEQVLQEQGLINKFLEVFGFNTDKYQNQTEKAFIYIRGILNLLIGLTSFIGLIMVIYSFYLVFFSEEAKGMEKVKKNLKGIAIALVVLGLSRSIVSLIFKFYTTEIYEPGQKLES